MQNTSEEVIQFFTGSGGSFDAAHVDYERLFWRSYNIVSGSKILEQM